MHQEIETHFRNKYMILQDTNTMKNALHLIQRRIITAIVVTKKNSLSLQIVNLTLCHIFNHFTIILSMWKYLKLKSLKRVSSGFLIII